MTQPYNILSASYTWQKLIVSLWDWLRAIFSLRDWVCWNQCFPGWKPPGKVQTHALAKLAYTIVDWYVTLPVLLDSSNSTEIHPLLWDLCWYTLDYYVTRIYQACWRHVNSCHAINLWLSPEFCPLGSLLMPVWPCKVNWLTHWFLIKELWLCCLPTGWWFFSLGLVSQFMLGNGFHFLTKTDGGALHPVAFGGQHARGNNKYLHSYLGKVSLATMQWTNSAICVGDAILCGLLTAVLLSLPYPTMVPIR